MGRFARLVWSGFIVAAAAISMAPNAKAQVWLDYEDVTDTNIVADPVLTTSDPEEKDYATGDFDLDGDVDLAIVRKRPFTTFGVKPNVLMMNEYGVMVDRTSQYAPAMISGTGDFINGDNARDVAVGNFDGNEWPDLIVANAGNDASPGQQPRIFINLGNDLGGNWLGFEEQASRLPVLVSPTGNFPNSCAVATGDVTGNGVDDIYLVDYRNDLEDRLLINDGTGNFADESASRLPAGFTTSGFGTAAKIIDMNGDGYLDIIKDQQALSIAYNDPGNQGHFAISQSVLASAPYHFDVGDLNNDGKQDIYVVQDPQDQFKLNNSAPGAIPVNWTGVPITVSPLTTGFGGNVHIADLDGDFDNDVLVTDTDSDVPDCGRRMAFLQNNGATPTPSLADPYTTSYIPAHHNGVYETAVADFNGDGALDLWVGHCGGTNLYFSLLGVVLLPVDDVACAQDVLDVDLSWTDQDGYDALLLYRDGALLATLPGSTTSYTDVNPGTGSYAYSIVAEQGPDQSSPASCTIQVSLVAPIVNTQCEQIDVDVALSWTNQSGVLGDSYENIEIRRNGDSIATLPGSATSYVDPEAPIGTSTYTLIAVIGPDSSPPAVCQVVVFDTDLTDLVLRFDDTSAGVTDSSQGIWQALTDSGRVATLADIDTLDDLASQSLSLDTFPRVWCELGTWPQNHVLSAAEGQALADYLNLGGDLYLAGSDAFCYDATTAVTTMTGIDQSCSDGTSGVTEVAGLDVTGCELGGFINPVGYNGEDTIIDHLEPLTTGTAILQATPSSGAIYNAGVINLLSDEAGLISQSIELGAIGEAHDRKDLVERYISCFPEPPLPSFVRGDVNQDLGVDISDAIALLGHLFDGATLDDCLSSLDSNDDGGVDISDAVYLLTYLFNMGDEPAAPFPDCGAEDTPDVLTCDTFACP